MAEKVIVVGPAMYPERLASNYSSIYCHCMGLLHASMMSH